MLKGAAIREMIDQWQGQSLYHKLRDGHHHETDGSNTGTLADVTGHHAT
jgi:hypothetical protein